MNINDFVLFLLKYCNFRVVLTCIILTIIATLLLSSSFLSTKQTHFYNSFLKTYGKIIKCSIEKHTDKRNNHSRYGLRVHYTYTIDDNSYCGSDIIESCSSLSRIKELFNFYSKYNDELIVYYNPLKNNESILNKGYLHLITYITLSTAFGLFFVAAIAYYFRNNPFFCGTIIASDITSLI